MSLFDSFPNRIQTAAPGEPLDTTDELEFTVSEVGVRGLSAFTALMGIGCAVAFLVSAVAR